MRTIGLVRHFKVIQSRPNKKWLNSEEFSNWVREYDHCDVIRVPSLINSSDWDMCISSDLSRAVVTAKQLYNEEIIYTAQLREIQIKPFLNTNIKLHYGLWLSIGRITWSLINQSDLQGKYGTIARVRDLVDQVEQLNVSRILIVTHGALMWYIRKELRKRRFKGPLYIKPENGKLYSFHKIEEASNFDE